MCFTACGFVKEKYLGSSPDSSAYFLYEFRQGSSPLGQFAHLENRNNK